MFLMIICNPVSYFLYWWSMKSSKGLADPIHHQIIFAMWVMIWMKDGGPSWICQNHAICICALQISGFAGLPTLHLSNPAICISRQVISTLLLEQRWISPKTNLYFSSPMIFIFRQVSISTFDGVLIFGQLSVGHTAWFGRSRRSWEAQRTSD